MLTKNIRIYKNICFKTVLNLGDEELALYTDLIVHLNLGCYMHKISAVTFYNLPDEWSLL